eukprot:scaffold1431_cov346-Pavlova_lutheri.AAC.12
MSRRPYSQFRLAVREDGIHNFLALSWESGSCWHRSVYVHGPVSKQLSLSWRSLAVSEGVFARPFHLPISALVVFPSLALDLEKKLLRSMSVGLRVRSGFGSLSNPKVERGSQPTRSS